MVVSACHSSPTIFLSPGSRVIWIDLGVGLHALVVGVDEDLAEPARERLVALGVELLVAEEDDAVVEQRLADVADRAIVEVLADVDAVDLGADAAGDRPHLDLAVAHGFPPSAIWLFFMPAAWRACAKLLARGYGVRENGATGGKACAVLVQLPG